MKTVIATGPSVGMTIKMNKLPSPGPASIPPDCTPNVTVEASGFESGITWEQVKQQITVAVLAESGRADVLLTMANGCSATVSFVAQVGYQYMSWIDVTGPDYWESAGAVWDGGWVLPSGPNYAFLTAINHWYDGTGQWLLRITSDWGIAECALAMTLSGGAYVQTTEPHLLVWDGPACLIRLQHGDWSRDGHNRVTKIEVAKL